MAITTLPMRASKETRYKINHQKQTIDQPYQYPPTHEKKNKFKQQAMRIPKKMKLHNQMLAKEVYNLEEEVEVKIREICDIFIVINLVILSMNVG